QNSVFESMAAWSNARFNLIEGDQPEVLVGAQVTASLLPTIHVRPQLGREFSPEDDEAGKADVVIISHRLWQRRFAGDQTIIGRTLNLSARTYTVIGVLPPDQQFPNNNIDILTPIRLTPAQLANHGSHYLGAVGRLKHGASITQASTELQTIARR